MSAVEHGLIGGSVIATGSVVLGPQLTLAQFGFVAPLVAGPAHGTGWIGPTTSKSPGGGTDPTGAVAHRPGRATGRHCPTAHSQKITGGGIDCLDHRIRQSLGQFVCRLIDRFRTGSPGKRA